MEKDCDIVGICRMKLRTRRLGDQPYTIPNRESDVLSYPLPSWIITRKWPRDSTPPGIR